MSTERSELTWGTGERGLEPSAREPELSVRQLEGLAAACGLVGDRWSLPIVAALLDGPLRYTEIQERVPGLAPNILTTRLRKLEQEHLLVATQYSARPPRFEYRLTPDGAALGGAIALLSAWSAARADPGTAPRHDECGSALELRWWCPACGLPVSPGAEQPILA
ncbi:MAG TPA: helix-turn-helix domain-containing protein [Solirubrobacteraceae bacterium]|nr:helix-turn-helix domain-containing protein [Solirubrobacteraceae bacterium]